MRPNTRKDLERILHGYSQGKFDRIKTAYLLIKLRYSLPSANSDAKAFRDIADFIAHDDRHWGLVMNHAEVFLENLLHLMRPVATPKGFDAVTTGSFLLTQESIVESVKARLSTHGLNFDVTGKEDKFMASVLENLAESRLIIKTSKQKNLLDQKVVAELVISKVISDQDGRKTIYAKATAEVSFDRKAASEGEWPQLTMSNGGAMGYPIMQAIPAGTTPKFDAYVWID